MPHALLLSPDDQAVSAITGVLEEMSVSCERPLDGVSAAQKLNSRSFDLVLVDCENLPAAKLIFDVCRRGKNGTNPVPIAIVDGRAGLPTAFRLGAELILTKPVAKDQARTTIRTAVSRLRKDEPARAAQAPEAETMAATPTEPEARAQAAAATVTSQPMKISEVTSTAAMDAAPVPTMLTAAVESAPVPATPARKAASPEKRSAAEDLFVASKPAPPAKLSDDPVLADLEKGDVEPSPAPVFSSYEAAQPKSRGPLVALLILAMVGGGFYAAWMYQPGFRELVQPQIDRVLALVGVAPQQKAALAPQNPARIPAQTPAKPMPGGALASPVVSPTDAAQPNGASTADSPDAAPAVPAAGPAATTPAPATAKPESPADSKKPEPATAFSNGELPGDNAAVILSSKGAEKRLVHHVPPTLPRGAAAQALEGTVILKTVVDDTGKVESVHLVEGNPTLADAAIRAVKQWRYRPYVRDGKSLSFQTVVLVDFQRP
jgi:TonB family protein